MIEIDADPQDWVTGCAICGQPLDRCGHSDEQRRQHMLELEAISAARPFVDAVLAWYRRWCGYR